MSEERSCVLLEQERSRESSLPEQEESTLVTVFSCVPSLPPCTVFFFDMFSNFSSVNKSQFINCIWKNL